MKFTLVPYVQIGMWAGSETNTGVHAYAELAAYPYVAAKLDWILKDRSGDELEDGFDEPLYDLKTDFKTGVNCTAEAHDTRLGLFVGMDPPEILISLRAALVRRFSF